MDLRQINNKIIYQLKMNNKNVNLIFLKINKIL